MMRSSLGYTIFLTILYSSISVPLPSVDVVGDLVYDVFKLIIEGTTEVVGNPANISNVNFYLYTSKDTNSTNHFIGPNNPKLLAQAKGKIYFFIHGWSQSRESTPWYTPLTEVLLKKSPDTYVVQIDWSKSADDNYAFAAFATESVGNIIGNYIYKLIKDYNIPSKKIVIIGHSLGGQVAGWIGKRYFELAQSKLPRIIALDPAGPLFFLRSSDKRLNENDAVVVMVVHSDETKFGYPLKCGTIDFFPNGGRNQPGCPLDWTNSTSLTDSVFCSHHRAYEIFPVAVQFPQYFLAKKCADYQSFENDKCEGIEVSVGDLETSQTGNFYLDTSDKPPYYAIDRSSRRN